MVEVPGKIKKERMRSERWNDRRKWYHIGRVHRGSLKLEKYARKAAQSILKFQASSTAELRSAGSTIAM